MQNYKKNQTIKKIIPINGIEFTVTISQIAFDVFKIEKMICTEYDILSMPPVDRTACIARMKSIINEKASEWFSHSPINTISALGRVCQDQDREGFEHDCRLFFHAENQHG